jgi:hypothetical protein
VKEGGGEEGERVKERSSPDPAQSGGHLLYRRRELRAAPRIVVDGADDLRRVCTHAGGCARNGGEKRNVLIVSVLLPIAIDLALRSNVQRRVDVLRMCRAPILQGVAATPTTVTFSSW